MEAQADMYVKNGDSDSDNDDPYVRMGRMEKEMNNVADLMPSNGVKGG
jgi:hypothetical protein